MLDGTLYPCRRLPHNVGNVNMSPLKELYINSTFLKKLRSEDIEIGGCTDCIYKKLCQGGLKCLSYAMTGDPFKKDPGCFI